MTIKIGINGFGRIGRSVLRAYFENMDKYENLEFVAINDPSDIETSAHLLKYDSVHGKFNADISVEGGNLVINGKKIKVTAERDMAKLTWGELGVDIVMECTGIFTSADKAGGHIDAGAKRVMISAPGKDGVKMYVYGVNDSQISPVDKIISIGSCTTNCLAPIAKVLNDNIGIVKGHMTTIHAYTSDQNLVDSYHRDMRRARAAAVSMIPTSTGAAKAIGLVLPELNGKLDGVSIRVPTPDVSFVDFSFEAARDTTVEEVDGFIKAAAKGAMKGVLSVTDEYLVSIDFTHDTHSSIYDLSQTKVLGGNFVRIGSWYDNEWGFSNRMLDMAKRWSK